ncbi:MAG TPA: DUF559 domain-containing protein [Acidimicrobiales bacterium]|nr:DUF559 domain-containing protein [Acidimicrobiales bacterium]
MDDQLVAAIDRVGRHQHGLLKRAQALDILGRGRMERWVTDGRLQRVQREVLRIAGAPRTPQQEMLAAAFSADGAISHRSAAWLWSLTDRSDSIDISIRYPRKATLRPPAIVHRIRDLDPTASLHRHGLLLTNPMRTLVDLGLVGPWWEVDAALGRAIASRLLPLRAVISVREALARRGRNGTGVMQRVFDERLLRGADEDSQMELRLLRITRRFALPAPTFQYEVWHHGRFIARPDVAYPQLRVAIEADGYAAHSSPEAFQLDRERQNRLAQLGWTILRFTHHDLVRRHRHVADVIASVL